MSNNDEHEIRIRPRKPPIPKGKNEPRVWALAFKQIHHHALCPNDPATQGAQVESECEDRPPGAFPAVCDPCDLHAECHERSVGSPRSVFSARKRNGRYGTKGVRIQPGRERGRYCGAPDCLAI